MTYTDWHNLGLLVVQYIPWLVPFAAAVAAWVTRIAPWVQDKRVQALAAQAVAAAENLIGDPAQRFSFVDGLLHDVFPTLKPEERKAIIEGAVTALHITLGSFQSAEPPTPPTPAEQAQAAKMQADFAALQQVVSDLAAVVQAQQPAPQGTPTKKLGGKASSAASIILPDAPPVAEAAHPDAS